MACMLNVRLAADEIILIMFFVGDGGGVADAARTDSGLWIGPSDADEAPCEGLVMSEAGGGCEYQAPHCGWGYICVGVCWAISVKSSSLKRELEMAVLICHPPIPWVHTMMWMGFVNSLCPISPNLVMHRA